MKRKIFIGLGGLAIMAAAAIVTVSTVNANFTPELSDLMIKNLEALSRIESGQGSTLCNQSKNYRTSDGGNEGCYVKIEDVHCETQGGPVTGPCWSGRKVDVYDCNHKMINSYSVTYSTDC
jgi:hypothetical protein